MSDKYFILRQDDIREALTEEWQDALSHVAETIRKHRMDQKKSVHGQFWVLSMSDMFAQEAIETYINRVDQHIEAAKMNDPDADVDGLEKIVTAARRVREQGIRRVITKVPD